MAMPYFKVFNDLLATVSEMDDGQAGRLFRAMLMHANGEEPDISGAERLVYLMLKGQMDRERETYTELCEKNAANGTKGGRPKKANGLSENRAVNAETQKTQDKDNNKDKDKDNNNLSLCAGAREGERAGESAGALEAYARQRIASCNPRDVRELIELRGRMGDELIRRGIDEAAGNGAGSLKYALAILNGWIRAGIRAPEDLIPASPQAPPRPMISRAPEDEGDFYSEIMMRPKARETG